MGKRHQCEKSASPHAILATGMKFLACDLFAHPKLECLNYQIVCTHVMKENLQMRVTSASTCAQYLDIRRKLKRNGAQPGQKTEDRPLPLREVMVSTRKQFGDFGPNSNPGVLQDDGSRSPRNEASQKALPREGATDSSEVQCRKRGSDSNPNLPRDKGNKCPRTKACDTPGNNAV